MTGRPDNSCNLIVLPSTPSYLTAKHRCFLSLLMGVDPAARVSFLVISTTTDAPLAMKAKCTLWLNL
jgi:hypothetical protein